MNYDLAKRLRDAGFPQTPGDMYVGDEIWDEGTQSEYETPHTLSRSAWVKCPTLSELIEACGNCINVIETYPINKWIAREGRESDDEIPDGFKTGIGSTPEEAVANLWLALNEKPISVI